MPDTTQVSITAIQNGESVWENIIHFKNCRSISEWDTNKFGWPSATTPNYYEIAYTCATYSIRTPPLGYDVK